ncbi:hypothetical protein LSTR_LSTR008514 [Laodelphax striatellus]|uniref:Uncharacterized protein n=1 Tax=Laodelphax striatellus TaxID=195883 RepID=A0A482WQY7_LAOST|nr:hypothetical protein LSTR_LSTR008514 [Laodelphax striatellus]
MGCGSGWLWRGLVGGVARVCCHNDASPVPVRGISTPSRRFPPSAWTDASTSTLIIDSIATTSGIVCFIYDSKKFLPEAKCDVQNPIVNERKKGWQAGKRFIGLIVCEACKFFVLVAVTSVRPSVHFQCKK